jgi:glutamate-ammonia-ligase adenylyltransferase
MMRSPARRSRACPSDADTLAQRLAEAGFDDPAGALRIVEGWRGGGYPALRSPQAREALEALLPGLIAAFAEAPDSTHAIIRFDAMLSRLPSAINFFRLLEAQPALAPAAERDPVPRADAGRAARPPCRTARRADRCERARSGCRYPALIAEMAARERGADYQWQLEHVRRLVGEKRFALGAQIVAGCSDPLEVSAGYARVAEAAIEVLARATVEEFERAHGRVPDSELVILALGRMGGQALTHASDLDLIYLFTGDYSAESDGPKPLGAVTYYNRLSAAGDRGAVGRDRGGAALRSRYAAAAFGRAGAAVGLARRVPRYQREDAWTWEHMALTRARPVFGSPRRAPRCTASSATC